MKRKWMCLCTALVLLVSLVVPVWAAMDQAEPEDGGYYYIMDMAGLLTAAQQNELEQQAAQLSNRYECSIHAVILDDYLDYAADGDDALDVAGSLYQSANFGWGDGKDGILLLISMAELDYALEPFGDFAEEVFTSDGLDTLTDAFLDDFRDDDWFGGFTDYVLTCGELLQSARVDTPHGGSADPVETEDVAVPVSAGSYIMDLAGLLTENQKNELEQRAARLSEQYQCGIYVVTVDDFMADGGFTSVRAYAEDVYKSEGLGWGSGKDGSLLLLSMADRDYALIAYGSFGNAAFTDYGKDVLSDAFLDDFRDDDWYGGFSDYIETSGEFTQQARAGNPFDVNSDPGKLRTKRLISWAIVIGAPCLIAGVVCLVLRGRMKSVAKASFADTYLAGRVQMHASTDNFTHTTVSRVKIKSDSNSGGGTTVSSSGFSGKSGKF